MRALINGGEYGGSATGATNVSFPTEELGGLQTFNISTSFLLNYTAGQLLTFQWLCESTATGDLTVCNLLASDAGTSPVSASVTITKIAS